MRKKFTARLWSALFTVTIIASAGAVAQEQRHVAIISDHTDQRELAAMQKLLKKGEYSKVTVISLRQVLKNELFPYSHVWYHRTDTTSFEELESQAGRALGRYAENGGKVFLSMEAMPLLNKWGWEQAPVTLKRDTIKDNGFGRPLGFHSFKSHPLFEGMQGGAYVSKQPVDHLVRKHGFFGATAPKRTKVVGIDWTYITFTEENKLLVELDKGKGKVLAAGAYLNYAVPNRNAIHLAAFTENVFRYLSGRIKGTRAHYWNYNEPAFVNTDFRLKPAKPVSAGKWQLPQPSLSMQLDTVSTAFYDLVGRRMLWMGKLNGGMEELWIHPYMALRDLEAGVRLTPGDSIHWLKNLRSSVTVTPEYIVRIYEFGKTQLKEIYTVSFDQPYGVAHYELSGEPVAELAVKFAASLRYMWPYSHLATGGIRYGFDAGLNGHVISGQDGALNTAVVYSSKPLKQNSHATPERHEVRATAGFSLSENNPLNIYISGSIENLAAALAPFYDGNADLNNLFAKSNKYYRKLLGEHLLFETPDTLFNAGYAWALARTDQFVQTTPGLGTALMAGFGTTARGWNGRHNISGRPGYAWYFGRDGQWSAMAINDYGDFKVVKEQLETFIRFQDLNGKIYHELTSSGVAHYDASDATPLFIVLAAHYLRNSGDVDYIRHIWPSIMKAYEFCLSTDTDGDGLIENTNVGHGWIEGGALFGTHTEFYLAGCWAATLDAMDYLSGATGKDGKTYRAFAQRVKQQIDRDFWNRQGKYFFNGKMSDGSYMDQATGFATVPMYLNAVTDSAKSFAVMRSITESRFTTDWGIRMLAEDNPKYRPGSYHAGMVWPLYGGWGSMGAFSNGLYKAGFQYLMSNMLIYRDWAPGSIEETLNGEIYKPNGVCSHQCWSETMVVQPAIEGMLGYYPDAVSRKMRLAPYFPWHWPFATVKNIRMGTTVLQMEMKRSPGTTTYSFDLNEGTDLSFAPAFPQLTSIRSVELNGRAIPFDTRKEADGIRLNVNRKLPKGRHTITIRTEGGIGVLPVITPAVVNAKSKGLKILDERLEDGKLQWVAEGRPGQTYRFTVFTAQPVGNVTNARILSNDNNILTLELRMPESGEFYSKQTITVDY